MVLKIDILFNHYMKNKLFFSDVLYKNMREDLKKILKIKI